MSICNYLPIGRERAKMKGFALSLPEVVGLEYFIKQRQALMKRINLIIPC